MSLSVFDHTSYQPFLLNYFGDKSQRKGLKSKAAQAIGCHTTLISQVLHGQVIPTLEQAEKLNRFMGHNEEESHYFLLLVQKARAGTKYLETYFQNQLNQVLKARQVIKKRVGKTDSVAAEDELRYYSSWQYAAIHVALSVPELTSAENLAKELQIPLNQVRAVLEFLVRTGFAVNKGRSFAIGSRHLHLGADSPQISNHHINWRVKAIQSIETNEKSNYHYSAAVTLSTKDVDVLKELLIQNLKSLNKVIQVSPEEEIYALNFDFFNLRG